MFANEIDLQTRWITVRDAQAFKEIARLHAGMVYATCKRILGNASDAEEVAQDCFLHLSTLHTPISPSLGGWLHTLATRRSLDRVRGEGRRKTRERRYAEEAAASREHDWNEIQTVVDECIADLPEDLRAVLIAHFLEERSQAEIAEALDVSQSTISRRIDKGVSETRRELAKRGIAALSVSLHTMLTTHAVEAAPASLLSALGKLAISGAGTKGTLSGIGLAAGGLLEMKKYAVVVVLLIVVATILWRWNSQPLLEESAEVSSEIQATPVDAVVGDTPIDASPVENTEIVVVGDSDPTSSIAEEILVSDEALEEDELVASVAGRVVWSVSNRPVPNRTVRLSSESETFERTVTTNSMGEFTLEGLDAGDYEILVAEEVLFPEREPLAFALAEGQNKEGIVLELSSGGILEGRISIAGEPLADADIEIAQLSTRVFYGSLWVHTDESGRYRLEDILEGERTFVGQIINDEAIALGIDTFWSDMHLAAIREGETTVVDFEFVGGTATLEGVVFVNGEPAPDQKLALNFYERSGNEILGQFYIVSGEGGAYRISNLPEARMVVGGSLAVENSRRIHGRHTPVQTIAGATTLLDFRFQRGMGILEGRITRSGEPWSERMVFIMSDAEVASLQLFTDAEGNYRAENMPEGVSRISAELKLKGGGLRRVSSAEAEFRAGEVTFLDFDFPLGNASVEGFVLTDADEPVYGRITANFRDEFGEDSYLSTETRSDGHFSIEGLPSGPATLFLILPNGPGIPQAFPIELIEGETLEHDIYVPAEAIPQTP